MKLRLDRTALYLGKDNQRAKDEDARRQEATVNRLLEAFTTTGDRACELQLVADEVGMGKTFVALATAYTMLEAMKDRSEPKDSSLRGCLRAVLVLTPGANHALAKKWENEAGALIQRCALDTTRSGWFKAIRCETPDALHRALLRANDRRRREPVVIVAESNVFSKRVSEATLRFFTACLFRWAGVRLPNDARRRIMRGVGESQAWPAWQEAAARDLDLWDFSDHERFLDQPDPDRDEWPDLAQARLFPYVLLKYQTVIAALNRVHRNDEVLRTLCDEGRGISKRRPSDRRTRAYGDWNQQFANFIENVTQIYKSLWPHLFDGEKLPLVIADEAHHWRHAGRQDRTNVATNVAPLAQRMLLLTATPFQLGKEELDAVLEMGDCLGIPEERRDLLRKRRDLLQQNLGIAEAEGRSFSRVWGELSDGERKARQSLRVEERQDHEARTAKEIAEAWAQVAPALSGEEATAGVEAVAGRYRALLKSALQLKRANRDLERAMRPLIIRHRRRTEHRRYWIGEEYPPVETKARRPDQSRFHLAPGMRMGAEGELAQYVLMTVVADAQQGRGRTSLGADLTGCWATLWQSKDGRKLGNAETTTPLLNLLGRLTGKQGPAHKREASHAKVQALVKEVIRRWKNGEKSLIFCFRVPTAETLHELISEGIEKELDASRRALRKVRGSEGSSDQFMQQFRRSLTARQQSGIPLFIDRVLLGWLHRAGRHIPPLADVDLDQLAALCARATHAGRRAFSQDRPDRVLLARGLEHVIARSLPAGTSAEENQLLDRVRSESWITSRYGLSTETPSAGDTDDEADSAARSTLAVTYELAREAPASLVLELRNTFERMRARGSVLYKLLEGPNLLLPRGASREGLSESARTTSDALLGALQDVTWDGAQWQWEERANVLDALVRALLREDILLRLPREIFKDSDETWSESLLSGIHRAQSGTDREPLARRLLEFVRELSGMTKEERVSTLRNSMRAQARGVELVTGANKVDRDAIFRGFNAPLLPDILVCTSVGQEGIDLHRYCRHVVHYDLGWNPATLEQRTGRVDRLGSKTQREREHAAGEGAREESVLPGLDIGVPYLAATYDERNFEVLRARAQAFEILTGGDATADVDVDQLWLDPDDAGKDDGRYHVPLPQQMLQDLRVHLEVERP